MERLCEHGIGHPDPDDLAYQDPTGEKMVGVHGCCGCCLPLSEKQKRQEVGDSNDDLQIAYDEDEEDWTVDIPLISEPVTPYDAIFQENIKLHQLILSLEDTLTSCRKTITILQSESNIMAEEKWDEEESQQLIADMHHAAVGEKRKPIRGYVQDVLDVRHERDALMLMLTT